jgi:hypothetical protein
MEISRIRAVKMNLDVLSRGHAGRKAKGEHHFQRSRRKGSELLAESAKPAAPRDSGAMTSIEIQATSEQFVPDETATLPKRPSIQPYTTLSHDVGSGKERCQGSWQGRIEITRPTQTR